MCRWKKRPNFKKRLDKIDDQTTSHVVLISRLCNRRCSQLLLQVSSSITAHKQPRSIQGAISKHTRSEMSTRKLRLSSLDGQGGLGNQEGSDPIVSTLQAPDGNSDLESSCRCLEQRQSIATVRPSCFVPYLCDFTCSSKVYYRLYTEDGPLESYYPIYSNDLFISRVSSKSIAPPRTVASLKKYLCKIEGYQVETGKCNLYLSLGEKTPVEDSSRLALRGNSGAGSSEFDPVALIVGVKEKRMKAPDMVDLKKLNQWPEEDTRRYGTPSLYDIRCSLC